MWVVPGSIENDVYRKDDVVVARLLHTVPDLKRCKRVDHGK